MAAETILLAFAADPAARWTWPNSHQYMIGMSKLVRALGGGAFTHSTACCTDEFTGVALWPPPGAHPDEAALDEMVEGTISPSQRDEAAAVFEQMGKHHPSEPH